jgi:glycosyltransferase involved in cell wall biosynthesis
MAQWPGEKFSALPHVITVHDMLPFKHPEWFAPGAGEYFFSLMKQIDREKDVLICDSEATRRELLSAVNISEKRCLVVPLAAADIFSRLSENGSLPEVLSRWNLKRDGYVLSAAMFEPRKNVSTLIQCFSALSEHGEIGDLILVVVGVPRWGREGEEILKLAAKLPGRIVLTGYVSDQALCALYNDCRMFVYAPSAEGFGLPPLEAMQCGAPVITSNCSSLPEVVGEAAIKITPNNKRELSSAIKKVAVEQGLREELRQRGLERAKMFSWGKTAELTVEAYERALHRN